MANLKVADIAEITGKTPKTIHNHRNSGKISMEKDVDNDYAASVAEVQRAYNNIPDIAERLKRFIDSKPASNENESRAIIQTTSSTNLEFENAKLKELLRVKDDEIDRIREDHEKTFATFSGMTKMLENQTNNAERLADTVDKMIKRDEDREERLKQRRIQAKKERQAEMDKPKSFMDKILGR